MRKVSIKLLTVVLISSLFFGSIVQGAIISPPILDISNTSRFATGQTLQAGDSFAGSFDVIFRVEDPEVLYLSVKRLDIEDASGEPIITERISQERDTLDKWIKLDQNLVYKPANTGVEGCNGCNVVKVTYTVDIPSYARGGGHYAAIVVSKSPPQLSGAESGVAIGEELVYQLFINLDGDIRYDSKIINFDTRNGQRLFTSMPVNFITTLQNDGNSYVVPKGFIYIYAGGAKIREDGTIFNPGANRLFPGKSRTYFSIFSEEGFDRDLTKEELEKTPKVLDDLMVETYQNYPYVYGSLGDQDQKFLFFNIPKFTNDEQTSQNFFYGVVYHINSFFENLFYQISNFRIGVFNAQLDVFAGNQAPLNAQTTFFVIPLHLIGTVLVIFGSAYFYFKRSGGTKTKSKKLKNKV